MLASDIIFYLTSVGEKSYPVLSASMEVDMCGLTDDDLSVTLAESDQSLSNSITLSTVDEESSLPDTPGTHCDKKSPVSLINYLKLYIFDIENSELVPATSAKDTGFKYDPESDLIMDMILADDEYDDESSGKLQDYMSGVESILKADKGYHPTAPWPPPALSQGIPVSSTMSELYNWSVPP